MQKVVTREWLDEQAEVLGTTDQMLDRTRSIALSVLAISYYSDDEPMYP